ncbi:MAG: DEAD/DEAH box helicase, partial [Lactobacillus sp.]|nr:DEAD/DEAH box helicase [Lactobacillus sp.]
GAWAAKKARVKQKIRDIAEKLIKIAAERELKKADTFIPPEGVYDEFCAGFPFTETDDQINAINDVIEDLNKGMPMDRLICGDVGFGKTEVALRAAFIVAQNGAQVAIIVPTTLLARQHYYNFKKRFEGFPVRVKMLSRLVTGKESSETKKALAEGGAEIVIGTHALLSKDIKFCNLGLLIIDEEQHFGVVHKEKLKNLKTNVHVLTLTATPIPRTLQLSLTGVKQLSVIATPPVDRLAARTFVMPFDKVMIKEAIYREKFRGGQTFFVCPRVSDIFGMEKDLKELVPDINIAVAHGQMPPTKLEDVMTDFAEGHKDLLLSTTIIESGIDMPSVNTMIVHRADMFGLAQLYQLRGRIGRSKIRGYCYFTVPNKKILKPIAERRLNILQALDTLGAGFSLASHDMDIRGSGNILGEEQSGHIKEVGISLYQHMLEEEVMHLKASNFAVDAIHEHIPQISTGIPIMIPESYVQDLGVRLGLYKRIGDIRDAGSLLDMREELVDRFGPIPEEVDNLLKTVEIKYLSIKANVDKIDAGAKGILVTFRNNIFNAPDKLIDFVAKSFGSVQIRPDQKLFIAKNLDSYKLRVDTIKDYVSKLVGMLDDNKQAS